MNEAIQQNLRDIGIEITFEVVEWNSLLGLWRDGARAPSNRGITAINISYAALDPFNGLIRFLKTELTPPAANNWGFFSDPWHGAIIDRAYNTFDPAAQAVLLQELHARVVDDALFLFLAHDLNPRAMSRRVQGFVQAQSWFQELTPIRMT
jgi:ABC-type transport system substrate-binding protein